MRIVELDEWVPDEWQGVTPELVTDWLTAHGWTQKPTQPNWWFKGDDGFMFDAPTFGQVWFWAYALAAIYANGKVQALLREINPRMRKGMPSEAARKACAFWLVRDAETGEVELHRTEGTSLYSASDYKSGTLKTEAVPLRDFGDWMEFWPCDKHGNKLRWPTDANGAML